MNKKRAILLILLTLILITPVLAQDERSTDYFTYEQLAINLIINSSLFLDFEPGEKILNYVKADLSFIPQESFRQQIASTTTTPEAEVTNSLVTYTWDRPREEKLDFKLESDLYTKSIFTEVKEKIQFPLIDLNSDTKEYLKETELIDYSHSQIITTANRLAEGEDDLYVVVHKIAKWVNKNIVYDLNTQTADAAQKASWVVENREGVCDELTNLFIAMLRSIGIPARFVTGVSYTTSELFENPWGPHGWAEVYFPEYGWIPFDVTYNQLGFIDATHIKLKQSTNSDKSSIRYEWEGKDVSLTTGILDIEASVTGKGLKLTAPYDIEAEIIEDKVKFGSYNLLEVSVINKKDYYVPVTVFVSRSEGIRYFDNYEQEVLLKPNENKKIFWIIEVDDDLRDKYEYTINMKVYTLTNQTADISFNTKISFPDYSLQDIDAIRQQREQEEVKTYSKNVDLECDIEKEIFYLDQNPLILCSIQNTGNTLQNDIRVCYQNICKKLDLGIASIKLLNFTTTNNTVGTKEEPIIASNEELSKSISIEYTVLDRPELEIINLEYPEEIELNQPFIVKFDLNKLSETNPKEIITDFKYDATTKHINIDELYSNYTIALDLNSKSLVEETNTFKIDITYKDDEGNTYTQTKEFTIKLINLSWWDKVKMFIKKIAY